VFTGGVTTNIYLGYGAQTATLTVSVPAGTSAIATSAWSGSYLGSTTTPSVVFTPTNGGTYGHTVVITNGYGCKDTITTAVDFCVKDIRVPNSNGKVYLCHVPSGNAASSQTLSISTNAVPAHLTGHAGDKLGSCTQTCGAQQRGSSDEMVGDLIVDADFEMAVYPNPSNSEFHLMIESISTDVADVMVYDISGRIVERAPATATTVDVTVGRNLAPGVYFVEVRHGDLSKKIKVVKL
jgi:hypothetical protein